MDRDLPVTAARASLLTVLGITMGIVWIIAAPAGALAACTSLGGSVACGADTSHTEVGRRVIFPHGPPGERIGDYVIRPGGTLPQVLPRASQDPGSRPLNRLDGLTDPRRGENFGAFEFRSPPPPGLSSTGPLR